MLKKKPIKVISSDIKKNITLRSGVIYVIDGEVKVSKGKKVVAEDLTTIFITNGIKTKSNIKRSALIFSQGSSLKAKRIIIKACNSEFQPVKSQDNGGIWFLGNYHNASKDNISVKVNRKNPLSHFSAQMITTSYLGRHDQYISPKSGRLVSIGDDIDGISVLGVGKNEWNINTIRSNHSADDGIDVTNSHIHLGSLEIKAPVEDGVNLSSSRLEIYKSLSIDSTKNGKPDRDIFDFEVDEGASYLEIHQNCKINIRGVFGDQIVLSSEDMPNPRKNSNSTYQFLGKSKRSSTLIYSIKSD